MLLSFTHITRLSPVGSLHNIRHHNRKYSIVISSLFETLCHLLHQVENSICML